MRIVGMDTTSEFGSLALAWDGRIVEETPLHSADGFGHVLFLQLERLLARHGWSLRGVDGFAAAAGPGSFTGVRVGLAAAKGLADAAGVRAAAVSNLRALAAYGTQPLRAVFFDARRGEIYGAVYNAALEPVVAEAVLPLERWLAGIGAHAVEFVTPDPTPFQAALAGRTVRQAPRALAGKIALLGAAALTDPAALDANYVRRSDAELFWKES